MRRRIFLAVLPLLLAGCGEPEESGCLDVTSSASLSHLERMRSVVVSTPAGVSSVSDRPSFGLPGRRASPQLRAHHGRRRVVNPRQHHTWIVKHCALSRSCSVLPGPPRYGHRSWVLTGTAGISRVAAAHLHGRYWARREPGGRVLRGGRSLNSLSGQSVPSYASGSVVPLGPGTARTARFCIARTIDERVAERMVPARSGATLPIREPTGI